MRTDKYCVKPAGVQNCHDERIKGTSKNSHVARCGRFLKAQKEFLNVGVSVDTPREEYSFLSQKDPQPEGRRNLMDFSIVVKLLTYRFGYARNFPPSCLFIISCLAPYANF